MFYDVKHAKSAKCCKLCPDNETSQGENDLICNCAH